MNRPTLITLFLALVTCAADASAKSEPASKPNIIFILTDDQNPDTLGCFGGEVLTPTLDKLCRDGVKFTRAYNSSSVCTPSRYTCLTGQYASRCTTERFLKLMEELRGIAAAVAFVSVAARKAPDASSGPVAPRPGPPGTAAAAPSPLAIRAPSSPPSEARWRSRIACAVSTVMAPWA